MTDEVTRIEIYYAVEAAFARAPLRAVDVIAAAEARNARDEIISALRSLPGERLSARVRDLWIHYPDMPSGAVGDQ